MDKLRKNVEDWIARMTQTEPSSGDPMVGETRFHRLLRDVANALLERHGHELFGDPSLHMTAPVSTIRGHRVESLYGKTNVRVYLTETGGFDATPEEIADGIAEEIRAHQTALAEEGFAFCPHWPVANSGSRMVIDPVLMEPVVPFFYRYGKLPLREPCPPCDVRGITQSKGVSLKIPNDFK